MNKRQFDTLVRQIVIAYRQGSDSFTSLMDRATVEMSDDQWDALEAKLDEAAKLPPLELSRDEQLARLEYDVTIAKQVLYHAQQRLDAFKRKQ
jgi:hypothetical protein